MAENIIYRLTAGELSVGLEKGKGGISLYSIRDKKLKKNLLTHAKPLFTLTARAVESDDKITIRSDQSWAQAEVINNREGAVIILSGNKELPGVTVTLTALCEHNRITWTTSLSSINKDYALYECDYPALSFDTNANTYFFSPYGVGEIYPSSGKSYKSTQNYPSYGASMQYLTFFNKHYRRGIYYGLHDPNPAYKKICFEKAAHEKVMTLKAIMPLTAIDTGCNSQSLEGRTVWELYDGDWYDAAVLYRTWMEKEASWLPEMKDGRRTDIPDWFLKNNHWWLVRVKDDDSFADDIIRATKDLGVETTVHLYDWFQIPYDNDYPHYFPMKECAVKGIQRLKEAGIRVMPYINGRLWDTKDRGMEDWQFSSVAKPNCTKDRKGVPFIETYNSKEADGSKVELSIMCPSTALWQEKVRSIVDKLLNEVGVNAVYIDQIAAASPYLCEDRNHSHLPGGGTWWFEGYKNLTDHVKMIMPVDTAITTECTGEPYMKHIQGYLSWLWVNGNQVPAFPVVYSGYVGMFGRSYAVFPKEDVEGQKMAFAESLTYGEQMGWVNIPVYESFRYKDFYKKCVKARAEIGEYFYGGRMLRPPVTKDDRAELVDDRGNGRIYKHSAVYSAVWERGRDKKKLLLLVNAADEDAQCSVECELPDGKYALNGMEGKITIKGGKAELKLPALSVVYAEI